MATKCTACEEAADWFDERGNPFAEVANDIHSRLRAEGRELKRLRKLILKAGDPECAHIDADEFEHEAKHIQKARTKK